VERRGIKALAISDLQRSQVKESLGAARKVPCGCCLKKFLEVPNLPLKVSLKAIMDIRIMWSGNLSSATVFGGEDPSGDQGEAGGEGDGGGGVKKSQMVLQRLGCYDKVSLNTDNDTLLLALYFQQVGVCVFCAQFFQVQEDYRPSYSSIVHQEKKAAYIENKRREQEYWDPLKMMEKDRELMELRKTNNLLSSDAASTAAASVDGGDIDGAA
jgi:hypothetical protein